MGVSRRGEFIFHELAFYLTNNVYFRSSQLVFELTVSALELPRNGFSTLSLLRSLLGLLTRSDGELSLCLAFSALLWVCSY